MKFSDIGATGVIGLSYYLPIEVFGEKVYGIIGLVTMILYIKIMQNTDRIINLENYGNSNGKDK